MERVVVRDVELAYEVTGPARGGAAPVVWGHGVPTRILAWSGDPAHPESTAHELCELLPQADLFVARTGDDFRTWTDRSVSFLRSLPAEVQRVGGWILHVDLDQFLAAVEVLRRPELAGRPVIVGGDGDPTRPRQVVATASYEARAFGVRSGMPLRQAARRCPDGVFLPSDRPAYEAASDQVMAALRSLGLTVEVWGWDEAFVAEPSDTVEEPEETARRVQRRVLQRTGLRCAVGIGETKLQAKTATGFAKPGGIARLTREAWLPTMGDRPVTDLSGIGARTALRLVECGIRTVAELAAADHVELARRFGPTIGPYLKLTGMGGGDAAVVDEPHVARGRSREETFERDLTDRADLDAAVTRLAREVADSVVAEGRRVTHVAVKVRSATFFTRTKTRKLPGPSVDRDEIARAALAVLDRFELDRPVRLLGVRLVLELQT